MNKAGLSKLINSQTLNLYYNNCFPFEHVFNWLTYNNTVNLKNREIALSINDEENECDYITRRIQIYQSAIAFKREIKKKLPYRIDIAGLYCIPANKKFHNAINDDVPIIFKEVVFDIDMEPPTDKKQLLQYWKQLKSFMVTLNNDLRNNFGFTNLLFVFSGKKGFHCWICERKSLEYCQNGRNVISDYFKSKFSGYLDCNVTTDMDHLTKIPFCVHPNTSKICVPIDVDNIDDFDPFNIPKINCDPKELTKYIQFFENFVSKLTL